MSKKHSEENNEQINENSNAENSEFKVDDEKHFIDDDDDEKDFIDDESDDDDDDIIPEPQEFLTDQQLADDAKEFDDDDSDIDAAEMSYNENEFKKNELEKKPVSKSKKKPAKKSNKKGKSKAKSIKVAKIQPEETDAEQAAEESEQSGVNDVDEQKDEPVVPKSERRTLRYTFNDKEMHDLSLKLAMATKSLQALEEEKSSVVAQYGSKIKQGKANCNVLSNLVADGWEFREVDVTIEYHKPAQGQKTIKRSDTGEEIVEKMDAYEFNLFNQPTENE